MGEEPCSLPSHRYVWAVDQPAWSEDRLPVEPGEEEHAFSISSVRAGR